MQPFSTFRATVKRLVSSGFEPERLLAFRTVFPGFLGLPGEARGRAQQALAQPGRRRYSGALFAVAPPLSRARYASVCVDASGEDGEGLCRELRAYASALTRGKLYIGDLGRAESTLQGRRGGWSVGERLGLHFDDLELFDELQALGVETRVGRNAWRTHLDYTLEDVCIPDTVDLRLPDTQEWFFRTFRHGFEPFWRKRADAGVQRFHDMLPTLMTAELGGNAATDAVGRVLRALGARALVYPSARSDPDAIVHHGKLRAAIGFNLVEFQGASLLGDDEQYMVFDDPEPWSTSVFWPRLRCEVAELGKGEELPRPFLGSWRLRGVRDAHERFWQQGGQLGAEYDAGEQTAVRARPGLPRTFERSPWQAERASRAREPVLGADDTPAPSTRIDVSGGAANVQRERAPGAPVTDR